LFKTSPVCSAAHAAIDAVSTLMTQIDAQPADVASIDAEVPPLVKASLVYDHPKNPQQAQFSLPYSAACAALHGRVRLQDLGDNELSTPEKRDLMQRVTMKLAADLAGDDMQRRYPESTRITLTLKDGRRATQLCGEAFGMPARPLSDVDLTRKFADCLNFADMATPVPDLATGDLLVLAERILGPNTQTR
jgi:2-methylcitrate dehydratase PrpD